MHTNDALMFRVEQQWLMCIMCGIVTSVNDLGEAMQSLDRYFCNEYGV